MPVELTPNGLQIPEEPVAKTQVTTEIEPLPQGAEVTRTVQETIPPHPSKGKYGPVINFVFGERIVPINDPRLEPIINIIKKEMRGKSGFVQLGEQLFFKNGELIEVVENPASVPETESIKKITPEGE